jgi:hypothetical protein
MFFSRCAEAPEQFDSTAGYALASCDASTFKPDFTAAPPFILLDARTIHLVQKQHSRQKNRAGDDPGPAMIWLLFERFS